MWGASSAGLCFRDLDIGISGGAGKHFMASLDFYVF